jgi:endonuclease-3
MDPAEKIRFIENTLESLYPESTIPLNHKDPYTLLVAVLLSAQSTDKCVNSVTPDLFVKADTPEKMLKMTEQDIYTIIKPCGLGPRKAKNIIQLSKQLVDEHKGHVPSTFEELERLPGIGHKSASVVMAQAFGLPAFPVDTHIHRLAKRWQLSNGKNVIRTEKDLKKVFPKEKWNKIHLQMIYFGREYCKARGHDPTQCPICRVVSRTDS